MSTSISLLYINCQRKTHLVEAMNVKYAEKGVVGRVWNRFYQFIGETGYRQ